MSRPAPAGLQPAQGLPWLPLSLPSHQCTNRRSPRVPALSTNTHCPGCGDAFDVIGPDGRTCYRCARTYSPSTNGHRPAETTPTTLKEVGVGPRIKPVSLASLRERHSGEIDWIVEGYFARGEVIFFAGAGESY